MCAYRPRQSKFLGGGCETYLNAKGRTTPRFPTSGPFQLSLTLSLSFSRSSLHFLYLSFSRPFVPSLEQTRAQTSNGRTRRQTSAHTFSFWFSFVLYTLLVLFAIKKTPSLRLSPFFLSPRRNFREKPSLAGVRKWGWGINGRNPWQKSETTRRKVS